MINSIVNRGVEDQFGLHVQLNTPEFFEREDFIRYIETQTVFSWHQAGTRPTEWSEVAVLVEPNLSGEGDSSDMPEDLWDTILAALKAKFGENGEGVPHFARNRHIVVRLTNMEIVESQDTPERNEITDHEVYTVEHDGQHYQSVFPTELADNSYPHITYADAAMHLVMVRDLFPSRLRWGFADPKAIAMALWEDLKTVPVYHDGTLDDECLEEDWLIFPAGTHREEVWHWFEDYFDVSVATDLMKV